MRQTDCFHLGHVIKPHGIHGDVNILLDVDNPEEYKKLESVFIEIDENLVPFFIETLQIRSNKACIHLSNINSIDEARSIQSCKLYLPLDQLPELEKHQFYYHEVIGYEVEDQKMGKLGIVENIYSRSGQDLLAMKYNKKEVLIPIAESIIIKADHVLKKILVELPEGLLDIYFED